MYLLSKTRLTKGSRRTFGVEDRIIGDRSASDVVAKIGVRSVSVDWLELNSCDDTILETGKGSSMEVLPKDCWVRRSPSYLQGSAQSV